MYLASDLHVIKILIYIWMLEYLIRIIFSCIHASAIALKYTFAFQCLLRLKEPSLLLRGRKADLHFVESVLDAAKKEYSDKEGVHTPEVVIDQVHLPPAPSHHNAHGPSW